MKYFEIDGLQCRALPFDQSLLGSNKDKLLANNVFYKSPLGEKLNYKDLEVQFSKFGDIKSLKISLNADHSQKGFAFICFENEQDAKAATADGSAIAFEPKDNR